MKRDLSALQQSVRVQWPEGLVSTIQALLDVVRRPLEAVVLREEALARAVEQYGAKIDGLTLGLEDSGNALPDLERFKHNQAELMARLQEQVGAYKARILGQEDSAAAHARLRAEYVELLHETEPIFQMYEDEVARLNRRLLRASLQHTE